MRTPYRNDHDALMARLVSLIDELDGLRARTRDLRDLERAEGELEREVAGVRRQLARVAPTRLPLLERVAIASPCSADWDAMTGDERTRFCQQCEKHVYDLSAMSAEEAEALLREKGGDACLRIYRRADGTVLTADCPVGVRTKRRRRAVASLVGGGMVAAGALLALARSQPPIAVAPIGVAVAPVATDAASATDPAVAVTTRLNPPMGGAPPVRSQADQIQAELAHVRVLLEKRAQTRDVAVRRGVEAEIKTARERIGQLSRDL